MPESSRKYLITINNPSEKGYNLNMICDIFASLKADFFAYCEEIGEKGTPHIHAFVFRKSAIRWNTIVKSFPGAHIDSCVGTIQENIDYLKKEGKYADSVKAETSIPGSYYEFGEMPVESSSKGEKDAELLAAIDAGKTPLEIIKEYPKYALKLNEVQTVYQAVVSEKYKNCDREVKVIYLFGKTGTGKTYSVFHNHNYRDICRITSGNARKGLFDQYSAQSVLVFEEFHSEIPIQDMLNYLDRYPVSLPARYNDRVACYTTVYIISNLSLESQYPDIQRKSPEVWNAFVRRISEVQEMVDGEIFAHDKAAYIIR